MPYRLNALDETLRMSQRDVRAMGEELANARRLAGLSQAEVARAIAWSASKVRRIERGQRASVTHAELACFAAVVGLKYSGRLFVADTRLRDATQLETIRSYRAFATRHGWSCRMEEPLPITGDLRAFDLVLRRDGVRVAHEFVSRLVDAQAQVRPLLRKQRDAGVGSLVLVLRDTIENRRAVRDAGDPLTDEFRLGSRGVLAAIREGRDPRKQRDRVLAAEIGSLIVGSLIVGSLIVGSLIVGSLIAAGRRLSRPGQVEERHCAASRAIRADERRMHRPISRYGTDLRAPVVISAAQRRRAGRTPSPRRD
jgi:transcriptional regulator with XRE-family HTH domain